MSSAHVLIVDDDPRLLKITRARLTSAGYRVTATQSVSLALEAARADRPDAIVSDVIMDELDGFALASVFGDDPDLTSVPIVLITSHVDGHDEHRLAAAVGARALVERSSDFTAELAALRRVLDAPTTSTQPAETWSAESHVRRLTGQMAHAIHKNQRDLVASERRFQALVENLPDVVWSATVDGAITMISRRVFDVLGISVEDVLAAPEKIWIARTHLEDLERVEQALSTLVATGETLNLEHRWRHPNGRWLWLHVRAALGQDAAGATCVDGIFSDVTERKQLEDQLFQAQKLEAIGQLTSGIAHDFNNILSVILLNAQFLTEALEESDPRHADAQEIHGAAQRAASLTRQLLTFSRREVVAPRFVDVNQTIREFEKMLRRVIGSDIELRVSLADNTGEIYIDPGQLEQVVMNLVVNARDAMPAGGQLLIQTTVIDRPVDPDGANGGPHVVLTVSDNGCGMSTETQQHIFEPFFTTKGAGKGTGLGLSTCYGIVTRAGGQISVHSEPDEGTVFKVVVPRAAAGNQAVDSAAKAPDDVRGHETVLLAEDDDAVRATLSRALADLGYRVFETADARQVPFEIASGETAVDLIVSDYAIRGGTGNDLVERVRARRGPVKALFMSGHTDLPALRGQPFIHKPFVPSAIAKRIRELLDGRADSRP